MPPSTPRVQRLDDRAREVLRILRLDASEERVAKVGRFIRMLGWDRVRKAAEYTASRPSASVEDPWYYTIGVINQVSARASYFYTLIHWIELGMRAGLDAALSERFGAEWHREIPAVYLDARSLGSLWKAHENYQTRQANRSWSSADDRPRVRWRRDAASGDYLPDYESPEDFLADLDFQPVTEMVLYAYEVKSPRTLPILHNPDGTQMPVRTARTELRWLRQFVRNAVAHNRPDDLPGAVFELDEFVQAALRTERILVALGYNSPFALARHESRRLAIVDSAVQRMGEADLGTLLKLVSSRTR